MKDVERITSRDNRRLVNARRVRDGKIRELVFVEGKRLVDEALRSPVEFVECFIAETFADDSLVDAVRQREASATVLPERLFRSIADTDSPQGIVVIARRPSTAEPALTGKAVIPVALYLSEINSPANLGAVLRTAEAAGVREVLLSANSADPFSPKALRASMGAAFRLKITTGCVFDDVAATAARHNLLTTGADAGAKSSYTDVDWKVPRLLVIGSEAHGLGPKQKEAVDEIVSIPMANDVESLNLAVSVGVILFEAKRQNG